jgi:hypothetical protein
MFGGRYIERGTVMRCDGRDTAKDPRRETGKFDDKGDGKDCYDGKDNVNANDKSSTLSAVFCSFPYLRIRKAAKHVSDHDKGYPEMSLLQSMYPFESTDERDSEQTTCTILESTGRIVSVPQIWTLSFGQTLLTCAPTSLSDIRSCHLQILSPAESLSFVRYKDEGGQPFCLRLASDTTLFVSSTIC